jgi:hypothetical protein
MFKFFSIFKYLCESFERVSKRKLEFPTKIKKSKMHWELEEIVAIKRKKKRKKSISIKYVRTVLLYYYYHF